MLNEPWRGQNSLPGIAVKTAVKSALEVYQDENPLNMNPRLQGRCSTIADVSTKIVLLSNGKQIPVYQADTTNTNKQTRAYLKHGDLSDEIIH